MSEGPVRPREADGSPSDIQTYRGPVEAGSLGMTLMHEHIFVRDPEVERDNAGLGWDAADAVERAVAGLTELHRLGVGTVVDLTVMGLGRDVGLVGAVAERVPVNLVAATGCYSAEALPLYYRHRGPGRLLGGPDPLIELFLRDITEGIAGTQVRAGIVKVEVRRGRHDR